jgi:hypothetical protein
MTTEPRKVVTPKGDSGNVTGGFGPQAAYAQGRGKGLRGLAVRLKGYPRVRRQARSEIELTAKPGRFQEEERVTTEATSGNRVRLIAIVAVVALLGVVGGYRGAARPGPSTSPAWWRQRMASRC